jgi:hypothetical protein
MVQKWKAFIPANKRMVSLGGRSSPAPLADILFPFLSQFHNRYHCLHFVHILPICAKITIVRISMS